MWRYLGGAPAVLASALVLAAPAAAPVPQCPKELRGELVAVQSVQAGWKGVAPERWLLTSAGIATSAPAVFPRADLKGGDSRVSKDIRKTVYAGLRAEQEKWLICGYGLGGEVEQVRRLPDQVDRCEITAARNQYNGHDVTITCK